VVKPSMLTTEPAPFAEEALCLGSLFMFVDEGIHRPHLRLAEHTTERATGLTESRHKIVVAEVRQARTPEEVPMIVTLERTMGRRVQRGQPGRLRVGAIKVTAPELEEL